MTDQSLPETIHGLQRLDLQPQTKHLVEEAAQLLGEGREIEARALVEKAQALAAIGAAVTPSGSVKVNGGSAHQDGEMEQLAARLSSGITSAITGALVEWQRFSGERARSLVHALEKRVAGLETELRHVAGFEERIERVSGTAESAGELARNIAAQLEALTQRVNSQGELLESVNGLANRLAANVTGLSERVDQQTGFLRGLQQRQAQRAALLNEVLGSIAKLREHNVKENEAEAAPA